MLEKLFRIIATIVGMALGYGVNVLTEVVFKALHTDFFENMSTAADVISICLFVIVFGLLFFIIAPFLNRKLSKIATEAVANSKNASIGEVIAGTTGMLIGLILAFLMSNLYGLIRIDYIPVILSTITYLLFGYMGLAIGAKQGKNLMESFKEYRKNANQGGGFRSDKQKRNAAPKLLDTSAIIDGRIADVMEAGFIEGRVIIPEFVLVELRHIADSSDSLKRNRGRRGLDMLDKMRDEYDIEIYDTNGDKNLEEIPEVDVKLLKLAKRMGGKVVTNDFNLNKVARINEVPVLNINELANSLKPITIPGEKMKVFLVKEGKEKNQALAYLDDGTMIVVEEGKRLIGKTIDVTVSSVLQTSAGRMIFAKPAAA